MVKYHHLHKKYKYLHPDTPHLLQPCKIFPSSFPVAGQNQAYDYKSDINSLPLLKGPGQMMSDISSPDQYDFILLFHVLVSNIFRR